MAHLEVMTLGVCIGVVSCRVDEGGCQGDEVMIALAGLGLVGHTG
jgi:hypothetical protein